MSRRDPHWLASWILTHCAPDYGRDSFLGDLLEQYEQRGDWWYWRQALGAIRSRTAGVLWTATETYVPAAEFIGDLVIWIALGMCAAIQLPIYTMLLISWTPLIRSDQNIIATSATVGVLLMGAALTAHRLRMRAVRVT